MPETPQQAPEPKQLKTVDLTSPILEQLNFFLGFIFIASLHRMVVQYKIEGQKCKTVWHLHHILVNFSILLSSDCPLLFCAKEQDIKKFSKNSAKHNFSYEVSMRLSFHIKLF